MRTSTLLVVILVLFGKGFSDGLIMVIKASMNFPRVYLTEKFMGLTVLAIDAVCDVIGVALASWMWK